MNVVFISYPIQEWILDESSATLGAVSQELQAISQDIKFALSTERNKYPIMGSNFGVEFLDLIGKDRQYVQAQLKKRITDALSIDDRITSIGSFNFEAPDDSSLSVSFIVETVLGKVNMTTEIIS
jgi:hypothetical protein